MQQLRRRKYATLRRSRAESWLTMLRSDVFIQTNMLGVLRATIASFSVLSSLCSGDTDSIGILFVGKSASHLRPVGHGNALSDHWRSASSALSVVPKTGNSSLSHSKLAWQ
jgi:hypothetical protein